MRETTFDVAVLILECCVCGGPIAMAKNQWLRFTDDHETFYCPIGHLNYFPGQTDAERLQKELGAVRAKLDQEAAAKRDAIIRAEKAERSEIRTKRRANAGVCPCCKRTFKQLVAHMKSKHPEVAP